MMLRDLDVLGELCERGGVTVVHSIPTVDEEMWRRSEPGTPPPRQRLMAMRRLREHGIRAGVLMAPLLPGLSAGSDALARTAEAALAHGACFLGVNVLNLGPGVREYFMAFLEREYPELTAEYERLYPTRYAPRWLQDNLQRRVRDLKEAYQLEDRYPAPRQPPAEAVQLPLEL
jgi:DNA repair photolyase